MFLLHPFFYFYLEYFAMKKRSEVNPLASLAAVRIISQAIQDNPRPQIKEATESLHEMIVAMLFTCWNIIPECEETVIGTMSSTMLAGIGSDLFDDMSINGNTLMETHKIIREYKEKQSEQLLKERAQRRADLKARAEAARAARAAS
jgi:hypothetical protein